MLRIGKLTGREGGDAHRRRNSFQAVLIVAAVDNPNELDEERIESQLDASKNLADLSLI